MYIFCDAFVGGTLRVISAAVKSGEIARDAPKWVGIIELSNLMRYLYKIGRKSC